MRHDRWALERLLFALAGTMTLLSITLGAVFSSWWLVVTAFVGVNQLVFVLVGNCPASLLMRRLGFASMGCQVSDAISGVQ